MNFNLPAISPSIKRVDHKINETFFWKLDRNLDPTLNLTFGFVSVWRYAKDSEKDRDPDRSQ